MKKTDPNFQRRLDQLAASMQPYRQAMIEGLLDSCRIASVKDTAQPDAPYGEKTRAALIHFLSLADELGFRTCNLDHKAGYVEWGEGERLIAVLCHLDVVPGGEGWQHDPFQPKVTNQAISGRGTIDDKGPAIASLFAMKALADSGFKPKARLRLIVGLDEESGMTCMQHYARVAELPTAGFAADADFPVIYAEKGVAWVRLFLPARQPDTATVKLIAGAAGSRPNMVPGLCNLSFSEKNQDVKTHAFPGVSAHASTPWEGKNAVAMAMRYAAEKLKMAGTYHPFVNFYQAVLTDDWQGRLLGLACHDESGQLTVNAGLFSLDETQAQVTLDIRFPVHQNFSEILPKLQAACRPFGVQTEVIEQMKPLYIPPDSSLVQTLNQVYCDLTGTDAKPIAIGGGTYARTMPHLVAFGACFPGSPAAAHQAQESILIRDFLASAAIYREALQRLSR